LNFIDVTFGTNLILFLVQHISAQVAKPFIQDERHDEDGSSVSQGLLLSLGSDVFTVNHLLMLERCILVKG
jgi:hypothetical protein